MSNLPDPILVVLSIFSPLFSKPTYIKFLTMFQGYVLCKGRRTISSALRMLNLKNIKNYSKFHDLFRRAKWSSFRASKLLLLRLIMLCGESITFSIDTTIERRKGPKIKGLGIQRDPVRSTQSRKVLVPGLNWLVCAVHIKFPWHHKPWALPFLTILMTPANPLSSSKNKHDLNKKKRHKTQTKWACQLVMLLSRWIGTSKKIIVVADSGFATYELANTCIDLGIELISRLRLDARTFNFPPPKEGKKGRNKLVGNRLPTFAKMLEDPLTRWESLTVAWYSNATKVLETVTGNCLWYAYGIRPVPIKWVLIRNSDPNGQAVILFSTNTDSLAIDMIERFVNRWQLEVTFEEARRHLGMETQRQWADKAIDRVTPCILAMYSIINLIALEYHQLGESVTIQTCSWYKKDHVTFSDIITDVRARILRKRHFLRFGENTELWENELQNILELLIAA